ncbi:hypothetical protein JOQ06_004560 [Pogonophryne albipinna]|uniref:Uncharacterized protein n=1 Tax=Pogonophryne albipinna TaxID=1090488 RepID=A0AAD6APN9_9TELE|nr:hypothetical protein JOQ06_004560 [Pogonophryne albipinna]
MTEMEDGVEELVNDRSCEMEYFSMMTGVYAGSSVLAAMAASGLGAQRWRIVVETRKIQDMAGGYPWGEHYARINTGPIRDPYRVWLLSIDLPPLLSKETLQDSRLLRHSSSSFSS